MMTTTTREIIDIIERHNRPKELSKLGLMRKTMGEEIKQYLARIPDLGIVDDDEFASYILGVIDDVYSRQGVPVPEFIAVMYGFDDREDELAVMTSLAEIEKIQAQTHEIRSTK